MLMCGIEPKYSGSQFEIGLFEVISLSIHQWVYVNYEECMCVVQYVLKLKVWDPQRFKA